MNSIILKITYIIIVLISPLIYYTVNKIVKNRKIVGQIYSDLCILKSIFVDLRKKVSVAGNDNHTKCGELFEKAFDMKEKISRYYTENDLYLTKKGNKKIDECVRLANSSLDLLSKDSKQENGLNRDTMEVTDKLFKKIEKLKPRV